MVTTAANVHDVVVTPQLLMGTEETIHGDSGYLGASKREDAIVNNEEGTQIAYEVNCRPSQRKKLDKDGQEEARKVERQKSSIRAKVEHVFAVVKRLFGFQKTRYRGPRKLEAKLNVLFSLVNIYLATV